MPCFVLVGSRHSCLEFWFRVGGSDTRALRSVSLCECAVSSSLSSMLLCPRVLCYVVALSSCFIGCMHSFYVLCCEACRLCISLAACFHIVMSCLSTWLMSILISCVFVSCLHMAGDLFCWPCACVFVLCEHMAFVLVFCVPCALILIVLTPLILFPDYWLICPTCLPSLPSI